MKSIKFFLSLLISASFLSLANKAKADDCCTTNCCDESFIKTLVVSDPCCDNQCDNDCDYFGKTFFSIRPQDSNTARRLLGSNLIYKLSDDSWFCSPITASFAFEYQRSFNRCDNLGKWFLFHGSNCETVGVPSFPGTQITESFDVNGNQLGITTENHIPGPIGGFCLNPKIENFIFDFDFKVDHECVCPGLWTRWQLVAAICKTDLGLCASTVDSQKGFVYPSGYYSGTCEEIASPYATVEEALRGDRSFGSVPALHCWKMSNCERSETKLAGIHFDLGYDFYRCDNNVVGASLHVVFPTGNRPNGEYVFEPIVGANKSWQIGATLNGNYDFWNCYNSVFSVSFEAIATHLFKSRQTRVFNLRRNGNGSQYLLLKKFDANEEVFSADRVANLLCGETRIGAAAMVDASFMLQWQHDCGWFANIGYNLWYRSKEKRDETVGLRNFAFNTYGIKGDLFLTDIEDLGIVPDPSDIVCAPNNTTASRSTISRSASPDEVTTFIDICDINFASALHPRAISNKVFGSFGYTRKICDYDMYVLVGAEAEFSNRNTALDQWGVLAKFGVNI